jgi:antitoxin ParD1/3/4
LGGDFAPRARTVIAQPSLRRSRKISRRPSISIQINRSEIEALVQQRLQSRAFQSVDDVISDALEVQVEREVWLQENKEPIQAKIDRGLAQLDRGEGIPGEKLRDRLAAKKAPRLADRSGS